MGREIRQVSPNWEHPKFTEGRRIGQYIPLYDKSYSEACKEWKEEFLQWEAKTHPDYKEDYEYWDWAGSPPDKEFYLPDGLPEKTWYQVYETVSEGTPVTPPFSTKDELYNYLITNGTFWDGIPWGKSAAVSFVFDRGWMPSGVFVAGELKDLTQEVY